MPTQTMSIKWARGSESNNSDVQITADTEKGGDYPIAAGAANVEIDIAFLVAGFKLFYAVADVPMTIKTNSSGAPQETLSLLANTPIFTYTGDGHGAMFAGNVTKLFITNPGASAGTLKIRIVEDATP